MALDTGIYAIENLRVRRVYVGATKRGFLRRWLSHHGSLTLGNHPSMQMQQDWSAYGPGWFKFVPLEVLSPDAEFAPHEQYWIDSLVGLGYSPYNVIPATEYPLSGGPPPFRPLPPHVSLILVEEASGYLRCHRNTVIKLLNQKKLDGFQLGSAWRITRESIDAFIKRREIDEPGVDPRI